MSPGWLPLCGAAAAVSLLELDAAAMGQFMISRPIVLGPALGAVFGDVALGAGLGALCELFSLGELPVGGRLPLNGTVAAACALLCGLGAQGLAAPAAFAAGLLFGALHRWLETRLRRSRAGLLDALRGRLSRGQAPALRRIVARELARQALLTLFVLGLALGLRAAWIGGWLVLPRALETGLAAGLSAAPWIGLSALLLSLRVLG